MQVDVKFLERIPGSRKRLYQFTAIDDCTRIRVLRVFDACNQATAIRFINDVFKRLPFRVLVVQTDNGAGGMTDDIHLFNEKLREWEDARRPDAV